MRKDKYYPYAAVFEGGANWRVVEGAGKSDNHSALLKRHDLLDQFECDPNNFVMGRIRHLANEVIVVDAASDLFMGKTGIENPHLALSPERRASLDECLLQRFEGRSVYMLSGGMQLRVPSVDEHKLKTLLTEGGKQGAQSKVQELTRL